MDDYSFTELADMHYCYGFADGESQEAAEIYAEKFPNREHPPHTVFQKIDKQLRTTGDLSQEDIECSTTTMADAEVKRKGRPKKRNSSVEVVETPTKKGVVSNGDDATPPAKRGRGRPPKAGKTAVAKKTTPGRGRGRPPKNSPSKKKKKESEDEDEDAKEEEKDESSDEASN